MRQILNAILVLLVVGACSTSNEKSNQKEQTQAKDSLTIETPKTDEKIILFFGNSLTAGYGLDLDQAFPAVIQKRLDSLQYKYKVINAGLSGETTASGRNRIDWVLRTVPDIFILELGANDGLRGLPLNETKKNLQFIIDRVNEINPNVTILLAGMMVPPNLGQDYTEEFRSIFPDLARENEIFLIPFLLNGVAGDPNLNLPDGIHPTPEGHKIVANTVWEFLKPQLRKN